MAGRRENEGRMSKRAPVDRTIVCYAEGKGDQWEAYCLTFDLAVHGRSFDEVRQKISDQVALYIEGVSALPPEQREHLLARRAPLRAWFRPFWTIGIAPFKRRDAKERHEFSFPLVRSSAA